MLYDDVSRFLHSALVASIYVSPRSHGLTPKELHEVARAAGLKPGEVDDALSRLDIVATGGRFLLDGSSFMELSDFNLEKSPEFRDWRVFEAVRQHLIELRREMGKDRASVSRDVLVEQLVAQGHARAAVEIAVTAMVVDTVLLEDSTGMVRQLKEWALPSLQVASRHRDHIVQDAHLAKAHPLVVDVVSRRTDGRFSSRSALHAFEEMLQRIQHGRFRSWWVQTRTELERADPSLQPTTVTVLAAALAEAALAFVVPSAKQAGLMRRIEAKPTTWRFSDLVKGAKSSDPAVRAILDERTAQRALDLNEDRQRIHAGFLIDRYEAGPIPDLKPEQAKDAIVAVETMVRAVLDWLSVTIGSAP